MKKFLWSVSLYCGNTIIYTNNPWDKIDHYKKVIGK